MLITPEYQQVQRQMHDEQKYGHSGGKWYLTVAGIGALYNCTTLLDYGCGTGRMVHYLKLAQKEMLPLEMTFLQLQEYDPGVKDKSLPSWPAELVSCIDVLEHIEPNLLGNVLNHLRTLTTKVLFTVISTRAAGKILPDGRNAHLIIKPVHWWQDRIQPFFRLDSNWSHTQDEWCATWRPI